ncbi:MAG: ABC transporter permease [Bacteroidetes bacterium]|nr:ABC transporter permease [Bacteroidota bacterium]
MSRYLHDIDIALDAIMANKLKSFLTALGIIFGVAAVISMLAIGSGAQQEILRLIEMVGVNNIIITPVIKQEEDSEDNGPAAFQKYSKGLTLADADAIREIVTSVREISPEISFDTYVVQHGKRKTARLAGVTPVYFDLFQLELQEGRFFNNRQNDHGDKVCIIGEGIKAKLFNKVNPINQYLKCGNVWLKVIGVMKRRHYTNEKGDDKLWLSNSNESIYIPIKTMVLRYKNRSLITSDKLMAGEFNDEEEENPKPVNYNQLDKIIVQVRETDLLKTTVDVLNRMLLRRHSGVTDFEITVPELLLKQQQKTKDIFNIVLFAIAGISLLVGGIGIMNIMLASVMERIREIGTRMAVGARKRDVVVQFIAESTIISVTGGFFGVVIGVVTSKLIRHFLDILTIVTPSSILIAFSISVAVGIIFGYMPARSAAEKDPVESLRYE